VRHEFGEVPDSCLFSLPLKIESQINNERYSQQYEVVPKVKLGFVRKKGYD